MTNWIAVVARNNLPLLRDAVRSFLAQDCGDVQVIVVDNGSTDGTSSWLHAQSGPGSRVMSIHHNPQHSVARAWNTALRYVFSFGGQRRTDRVLVCNSDVVLRPDTYRWLAKEEAGFVTAVGSDDPKSIEPQPSIDERDPDSEWDSMIRWSASLKYPIPRPDATRPHPDFSCFMIDRQTFATVGPFDESYQPAWFEDNKYHIEMHRHGIRAYSIDLPFLHVGAGGQTIKRATEDEQRVYGRAYARNKAKFMAEYGCAPDDLPCYEALFGEETFGIYLKGKGAVSG